MSDLLLRQLSNVCAALNQKLHRCHPPAARCFPQQGATMRAAFVEEVRAASQHGFERCYVAFGSHAQVFARELLLPVTRLDVKDFPTFPTLGRCDGRRS
jgi:hypothetical protein